MSYEFRDAVRQDVNLLILIAGGTGGGKTESALRLATGIAQGGLIVGIDTENGRMLHKADDYKFKHAPFDAPFTPERYVEAIRAAESLDPAVILLDSGSHEYDGEGGLLDMQAAEHQRLGGGDNVKLLSWAGPKQRHRRYRDALIRAKPHLIVCHRADDKVEIVKKNGKTEIVPKQSLAGAQGWVPICEKRLPFESTISLLVLQEKPGVPVPIKLESRHAELIALDEPLSEETGRRLAAWAAGAKTSPAAQGPLDDDHPSNEPNADTGGGASTEWADEKDVTAVLELAARVGVHDQTVDAIAKNRVKSRIDRVNAVWLANQRERLEKKLPAGETTEPEQSTFADMVPASARGGQ